MGSRKTKFNELQTENKISQNQASIYFEKDNFLDKIVNEPQIQCIKEICMCAMMTLQI